MQKGSISDFLNKPIGDSPPLINWFMDKLCTRALWHVLYHGSLAIWTLELCHSDTGLKSKSI